MRTSHSSWTCLEKSTSEAVTARVEEQPRKQPSLAGEFVLQDAKEGEKAKQDPSGSGGSLMYEEFLLDSELTLNLHM